MVIADVVCRDKQIDDYCNSEGTIPSYLIPPLPSYSPIKYINQEIDS